MRQSLVLENPDMLAAAKNLAFLEDAIIGQIEFAIGKQDLAVHGHQG